MSHQFPKFLSQKSTTVAELLLGCLLVRKLGRTNVTVRIVETEAYDETDQASHVFGGKTKRTSVMFGPPGYVYVYLSYGIHHCFNVVTGNEGEGAGVLIRAVEPLDHISILEKNRGVHGRNLTNGPGKLCQALAIDLSLYGHDLRQEPLLLLQQAPYPGEKVTRSNRIGITKDVHRKWRFHIKGNPYVSPHKK